MDFNKTIISKTSLINRSDAFKITQDEMYRNTVARDAAYLQRDGVIMSLTSGGLRLDSSSLNVTRHDDNNVKIKPGVAVQFVDGRDSSRMIVIPQGTEEIIAVESSKGTYDVLIGYATERVSSGLEYVAPGRNTDTDSIYLVQRNSYVVSTQPTGGTIGNRFQLARVYVDDEGKINPAITKGLVVSTSSGLLDTSQEKLYLNNYIDVPEDGILRIDNEYMEYTLESDVGGQYISVPLGKRGKFNTDKSVHKNGDTVYFETIIDLRQMNAAKLKAQESSFIESLKKGIVNFDDGAGDRTLVATRIPSKPNVPDNNSIDVTIQWTNQGEIDSQTIDDAAETAAEAQSIQSTINALSAEARALEHSLQGMDPDEAAAAAITLSETRSEITGRVARYNELRVELADVSDAVRIKKEYSIVAVIEQPTLIEGEQITQYIAEVTYVGSRGAAVRYSSLMLLPTSVGLYGDKIYTLGEGGQPDAMYRTIEIPIKPAQEAHFRVAAITEFGIRSDWSNKKTVKFTDYNTDTERLVGDIDNILKGDAITNAIASEEVAKLVESLKNEITGLGNRLRDTEAIAKSNEGWRVSLEKQINSLRGRIATIEGYLKMSAPVDSTPTPEV